MESLTTYAFAGGIFAFLASTYLFYMTIFDSFSEFLRATGCISPLKFFAYLNGNKNEKNALTAKFYFWFLGCLLFGIIGFFIALIALNQISN